MPVMKAVAGEATVLRLFRLYLCLSLYFLAESCEPLDSLFPLDLLDLLDLLDRLDLLDPLLSLLFLLVLRLRSLLLLLLRPRWCRFLDSLELDLDLFLFLSFVISLFSVGAAELVLCTS